MVSFQLSFRQLYLFTGFEGRHAKVGATGASKCISKVTLKKGHLIISHAFFKVNLKSYASTRRGYGFLGRSFPVCQFFSQSTRAIFARFSLPSRSAHCKSFRCFEQLKKITTTARKYLSRMLRPASSNPRHPKEHPDL